MKQIVSTEWLERNLDKVKILDASWHLPDSKRNAEQEYKINHIKNSIFFDIDKYSNQTKFINISSNKVYGDLSWDDIEELNSKYSSKNYKYGYDESTPLQFSGPYGCSKGSAEQYVIDFNKTYNLRTTSLRLSTIYGPNQFYNFIIWCSTHNWR